MDSTVCPIALFDKFVAASTFKGILQSFNQLCIILGLDPLDYHHFYSRLKGKLGYWKAQKLWSLLDKRAAQKEYRKQKIGQNLKVLVIGAGPCGLRAAIECALLGAKTVVVEKRDRFSRNNVLHIWPFVIQDLRNLGAKLFHPKFCAGSIDHISIRQLQCMLLKIALVLGVEVHEGLAFQQLLTPGAVDPETGEELKWRALYDPPNHYLEDYQFNVLIGADGKRNTIPGFPRRELRGKLAIGITANFLNRHSHAEERVQEISGVAFIFNQQFFKDMREETGIDLENIVYYKDETHYFVMCAKKQSLLEKGVIMKDYEDVGSLLSGENVDQAALLEYAREAADFATERSLPHLDYAFNHYGLPDVAMFDFTSLFSAENSSRLLQFNGHRLLMSIVGDSLHEPFWPTGSGCGRGFLGVFDTVWMIRNMVAGKMPPLECIAHREAVYRLLAQATPELLHKNIHRYSIDPKTRYYHVDYSIMPEQVRYLFETDDPNSVNAIDQRIVSTHNHSINHSSIGSPSPSINSPSRKKSENPISVTPFEQTYTARQSLIRYLQHLLTPYKLRVVNLDSSWTDGILLCALLSRFRTELVDVTQLDTANLEENVKLGFDLVKQEFGIDAPVDYQEIQDTTEEWTPNKQTLSLYLAELCDKIQSIIAERIKILQSQSASASKAGAGDEAPSSGQKRKQPHVSSTQKGERRGLVGGKRRGGDENADPDRLFGKEGELADTDALIDEDIGLDDDEISELLLEWEEEEVKKGGKKTKIDERVEQLRKGLLSKRSYIATDKWKNEDALVEKLDPDRVKRIEDMLLQDLPSRIREVHEKKKRNSIKTRKLDRKDIDDMEKKLEETGMGVLFKKDYKKAMSHQELQDVAAKTKDVRKIAQSGFEGDKRFLDFDQRLKALDAKIKSPPTSGAIGGTKELSQKHKMALLKSNVPKKSPVPLPPSALTPKSTSPTNVRISMTAPPGKPPVPGLTPANRYPSKPLSLPPEKQQPCCYLCNGRVYLAERICAEGFFLHKKCFRCAYCNTALRLGSYGFERSDIYGNQFFCMTHLNLPPAEKFAKLAPKHSNRTSRATTPSSLGVASSVSSRAQTPVITSPGVIRNPQNPNTPSPVGIKPLELKNAFRSINDPMAFLPNQGNSNSSSSGFASTGKWSRVQPLSQPPTDYPPSSDSPSPSPSTHTPERAEFEFSFRKPHSSAPSPRETPSGTVPPTADSSKSKRVVSPAVEGRGGGIASLLFPSLTRTLAEERKKELGTVSPDHQLLLEEEEVQRRNLATGFCEGSGEIDQNEPERDDNHRSHSTADNESDTTETSATGSGEEEEEEEFSEGEMEELEKTLKGGVSNSLSYDQAAQLALNWRQRRQGKSGSRKGDSDDDDDSDDEASSSSEESDIGETDTTEVFLSPPDSDATPNKRDSLNTSNATVYFTPRVHSSPLERTPPSSLPAGVPRVDSIPFADKSPEQPFKTPIGLPPKTRLRTDNPELEKVTEEPSPLLPSSGPPPLSTPTTPLRELKMMEWERVKAEAREKAKKKTDEELGIGSAVAKTGNEAGSSHERVAVRQSAPEGSLHITKQSSAIRPKSVAGSVVPEENGNLPEDKTATSVRPQSAAGQNDTKHAQVAEAKQPVGPSQSATQTVDQATAGGAPSVDEETTAKLKEKSGSKTGSDKSTPTKRKSLLSKLFGTLSSPSKKGNKDSGATASEEPSPTTTPTDTDIQKKAGTIDHVDGSRVPSGSGDAGQSSQESGVAAGPPIHGGTVSIESGKESELRHKIGRKYNKRRKSGSPPEAIEQVSSSSENPSTIPSVAVSEPTDDDAQVKEQFSKKHSHKDKTSRASHGPPRATLEEANLSGDSKSQESLTDRLAPPDHPVKRSPSKDSVLSSESGVSEREVRRIQKAAERLMRQQEQQRNREAQELQRKMQETEVQLTVLAETGKDLEEGLQNETKNKRLLEEWARCQREREGLWKTQEELALKVKELELEQKHSQLQSALRESMTTLTPKQKTSYHLQEEQKILEDMLLVVAQRDALMGQLGRLRARQELTPSPTKLLDKFQWDYRNADPVFI